MPSLNTGNAILSNAIAVDSSYNVGIGGAASGSLKLQVTGSDILVNGLTIGEGAGSIGSNTVLGASALPVNTTGTLNTAIGNFALLTNTTGYGNTSVGYSAIGYNTTGFFNAGVGVNALLSNTTGTYNNALGTAALYANTTGSYNTAVGQQAGTANTTGSNNTYIGYSSGLNITTGSNNTIIGNFAGTSALANNIVLADGAGNVRYQWDGTNNVFGNPLSGTSGTFTSTLAVNGAATLGTGASSYTFGGGSSTPSGLTDKDLTLKAWSPTSGTNEYSGDLILQSGVGTGNGSGKLGSVIIKVGTDGATSSTLGTYITSATFTKTGVGIGTSSPSAKLEVVGVDENLLKLRNGSGQPALVRFNDTSTTADPYVGSYGNDLAFGIYGVGESMRINSSRNVGIGTSSPSYKLDIRNDVGASTSLDPISIGLYNGNDGGSAIYFRNSVGGQSKISFGVEASGSGTDDTYLGFSNGQNTSLTERMRIASSGHVIVGSTTDSGYRFQVRGGSSYTQLIYQSGGSAGYIPLNITHNATSGTIELIQFNTDAAYVGYIRTNGSTCTFSGTALSDERFKENIKPIANALDVVSRIEFKEFNYTENKNESAGVIAQQLLNIPELSKFVNNGTDEDSFKTVDYNAIIGYLGKAIQELNQKVNEQQQTINSLINR